MHKETGGRGWRRAHLVPFGADVLELDALGTGLGVCKGAENSPNLVAPALARASMQCISLQVGLFPKRQTPLQIAGSLSLIPHVVMIHTHVYHLLILAYCQI